MLALGRRKIFATAQTVSQPETSCEFGTQVATADTFAAPRLFVTAVSITDAIPPT
jgi:hypothetical protein